MAYERREAKKITPTMEKALHFMLSNPNCTIKDVSEAMNVHYQTAYSWFKSPLFMDKYRELVNEQWGRAVSVAQLQLINRVSENDWKAVEYILDSAGYNGTQKFSLTNDKITINIEGDEE